MAAKSDEKPEVKEEQEQPQAEPTPESAQVDNKEDRELGAGVGREPQVAKEPKDDFDKRTTGQSQPWLNKDGSQNTGEGDTTEADKLED